ncbi:hypothetical protein N9Y42_09890 [Mariniblastus sp.]|nr:hypothetical protein [Mariniblastus sp.]
MSEFFSVKKLDSISDKFADVEEAIKKPTDPDLNLDVTIAAKPTLKRVKQDKKKKRPNEKASLRFSKKIINQKRNELFGKFPNLLRRKGAPPRAKDEHLQEILNEIYQEGDRFKGGTFGAAFEEIVGTQKSIGDGDHIQKLDDIFNFTENVRGTQKLRNSKNAESLRKPFKNTKSDYSRPRLGKRSARSPDQLAQEDVILIERMRALCLELKRLNIEL